VADLVEIRMVPHIVCPACGDSTGFRCDHVLRGSFRHVGPWFCDQCGHSFMFERVDRGIAATPRSERKVTTLDVLALDPQAEPVFVVVEGMRFEGDAQDDGTTEAERKQFHYEEHSCPVNWLRPVLVYAAGDADPHGLLRFVETHDKATMPNSEALTAIVERVVERTRERK
jgi:predicted RNA-binding Zn-ribbon protein involved in translation (DUF1610 family)